MKNIFKIFLTNWIHFIGILICYYIHGSLMIAFGLEAFDLSFDNIILYIIMGPIFFLTYGITSILIFAAAIFILDIIFFSKRMTSINNILFIEWILLIILPIYWAFEHEYWFWISLSLTFGFTQFYRRTQILRLLESFNDKLKYKNVA